MAGKAVGGSPAQPAMGSSFLIFMMLPLLMDLRGQKILKHILKIPVARILPGILMTGLLGKAFLPIRSGGPKQGIPFCLLSIRLNHIRRFRFLNCQFS